MAAETPFDTKTFEQLQQDLRESLQRIDSRVDCSEGSVVRTLLEAFAHELAVSYEQLRQVYRAGYLDTAEGSALDQVVALLGVERHQGGYLEGQVLFSRLQPAEKRITIPSGTRLCGPDSPEGRPCPVVETTGADRILEMGDSSVLMPVRAVQPLPPEEMSAVLEAGRISLMVQPLLGIDQVSNPAPLQVSQQPDTDEQLRQRARCWMERVNLGTVAAIEAAVREQGITRVKVLEPRDHPGTVHVVVEWPPETSADRLQTLQRRVTDAVERTRPAGIKVEILGTTTIPIQVSATLVLRDNLDASQQTSLLSQLRTTINDYLSDLAIGETVRASRIRSLLTAPAQVSHLLEPNDPSPQPGPGSLLWPTPADRTTPENVMSDVLIRAKYLDRDSGDVQFTASQRAEPDNITIILLPPVVDVLLDLTLAAKATKDPQKDIDLKEALQAKLDRQYQRQTEAWSLSVSDLLANLVSDEPLQVAFNAEPAQNKQRGISELYLIRPPLQLAQALVVSGELVKGQETQTIHADEHLRIGMIRKASAPPS